MKMEKGFAGLPGTSRFVALMPRLLLPFSLLLHCYRGQETGIYFVDSTKLAVCHNARSARRRCSKGWPSGLPCLWVGFFGFRLSHLTACFLMGTPPSLMPLSKEQGEVQLQGMLHR